MPTFSMFACSPAGGASRAASARSRLLCGGRIPPPRGGAESENAPPPVPLPLPLLLVPVPGPPPAGKPPPAIFAVGTAVTVAIVVPPSLRCSREALHSKLETLNKRLLRHADVFNVCVFACRRRIPRSQRS